MHSCTAGRSSTQLWHLSPGPRPIWEKGVLDTCSSKGIQPLDYGGPEVMVGGPLCAIAGHQGPTEGMGLLVDVPGLQTWVDFVASFDVLVLSLGSNPWLYCLRCPQYGHILVPFGWSPGEHSAGPRTNS